MGGVADPRGLRRQSKARLRGTEKEDEQEITCFTPHLQHTHTYNSAETSPRHTPTASQTNTETGRDSTRRHLKIVQTAQMDVERKINRRKESSIRTCGVHFLWQKASW